jgi:hypothetical protein
MLNDTFQKKQVKEMQGMTQKEAEGTVLIVVN